MLKYNVHFIEHNTTGRKLEFCLDHELTKDTPALTGKL